MEWLCLAHMSSSRTIANCSNCISQISECRNPKEAPRCCKTWASPPTPAFVAPISNWLTQECVGFGSYWKNSARLHPPPFWLNMGAQTLTHSLQSNLPSPPWATLRWVDLALMQNRTCLCGALSGLETVAGSLVPWAKISVSRKVSHGATRCCPIYLSTLSNHLIFLSFYLSIFLSMYLSFYFFFFFYLSIYPSIYLSIYLILSSLISSHLFSSHLIYLSFFLSFFLSVFLCFYLFFYLSFYLAMYLSILYLSIYL